MDEKSNGGIILVIQCNWEEEHVYQLWEVAKFIFNYFRIGCGTTWYDHLVNYFFYVKKYVFCLVILSNLFRTTYSSNTKYTHTYSVLFTTMNYTNHECITIAKKSAYQASVMKAAIKIFLVACMFDCKWLSCFFLEFEVLCIIYTDLLSVSLCYL